MAGFNRVILMGNLTRDPELKYLPSNTAVCEFGLAVNHRYRDRDGNQKEEVCFVDVTAWGRQGETINQYMTKGRQILIEGRLKLDQWTGQDGQKRSKLSVVALNFQFIGSREGGGAPRGGPPDQARGPSQYDQGPPYEQGPPPDQDPFPSQSPPGSTPEGQPPDGDRIPF